MEKYFHGATKDAKTDSGKWLAEHKGTRSLEVPVFVLMKQHGWSKEKQWYLF